jgi:hypothetical protein
MRAIVRDLPVTSFYFPEGVDNRIFRPCRADKSFEMIRAEAVVVVNKSQPFRVGG